MCIRDRSITYKNLYNEVQIGTKILINDGTIETIVKKIDGKDIICEVIKMCIRDRRCY